MIYSIYLNKNVKVFILTIYILTGQIGAGKSEAQKIFEDLNYSCFCADTIVRDLYKEENIIKNMKKIVPESIQDKKINIDVLRELSFNNSKIMKQIEDYIQPKVFKEFKKILETYNNKVILIVPIIKNLNIFKEYKMIYVHSKEKIRRKRIESRYNYNKIMINNIINYQKTIDIYKKDSNFIIENNSTLQDLEKKILLIIK